MAAHYFWNVFLSYFDQDLLYVAWEHPETSHCVNVDEAFPPAEGYVPLLCPQSLQYLRESRLDLSMFLQIY